MRLTTSCQGRIFSLFYPLAEDLDIETVTEIFSRVNSAGVGVFLGQSERQIRPSLPVFEILHMDESDPLEVFLKWIADRDREDGVAVLLALALPDGNLAIFGIDVLYPQPQAFHQPELRSIEKATHNPEGSIEAGQNSVPLIARKNDRPALYGCHFGLPSGLSTWADPGVLLMGGS